MVNKTFLSLILALLFVAMCLQVFAIYSSLQRQSQHTIIVSSNTVRPVLVLENSQFRNLKNTAQSNSDPVVAAKKSAIKLSRSTPLKGAMSDSQFKDEVVSSDIIIYGAVTDDHGQAIAGVVVKPDGKPNGVRSDAFGYYFVRVKRVKNHFPTLKYLKSGFKMKTIRMIEQDIDSMHTLRADMRMQYSSETVTVNGWVGETNGSAINNEIVKLTSLPDNLYYAARSDESGSFSFEGIRRGVEYKVDLNPSGHYKNVVLENLTVTDHDIPLYITLEPINLSSIEGVVIDRHGGSVRNLTFKLRGRTNSHYDTSLTTDEFGRFELSKFPIGELSFTTESPLFFKVTGIDLSTTLSTDLVIPVDIGPHQISGWVSNQFGLPIKGARAMLDAQFDFNGLDSSSIRTYVTDESGYFEFDNLGPGEHYITLYAKGFINQGLSYDTSARIDPLYLQLSQWSDSLIGSETLQ